MAEEEKDAAESRTVPYDRFQSVVASRNEMQTQLTELQAQVQTLSEKAATVDSVAAQAAEWKGKAETEAARFGTFREIASRGYTDPELVEAIEWSHSKLTGDDKPPVGSWLDALKADPSTAPTLLRPHLSAPVVEQAAPAATPAPTPQPKGVGSGTQAPGAPSEVTEADIKKAGRIGAETGDWSAWKELKKRMK